MTVSSENKENKEQSTVQQVGKKQVSKSESADKAKKSTPVRKPRAVRSNRAADLRRGKDLKNDGNQSMDKYVVGGSPKTTAPPKPLPLGKKNLNKQSPTGKTTKAVNPLTSKNNTSDGVQELSSKLDKLSTKSPLKDKKTKPDAKKSNVASPSPSKNKITDYFQYRKSERNLKKNFDNQIQKDLENKINNYCQDGLEIKVFEDKGRGIVTTKEFFKGEFVLEYIGDLINKTEAKEREQKYSENKEIGCYMYYFKHKDTQYCIDATAESEKFGRLVNHSRKGANLVSKIIDVKKVPHLVFFAKVDISVGTEILYDYGDRSKDSIQNHPWLTK